MSRDTSEREVAALPEPSFGEAARRSRITGSHVYTWLSCEHAVALDFFEDPERSVPRSESLELLLARGREFEDEFMQDAGFVEPEFPRGDFAAGAAATERLLAAGTDGVAQGVLFEGPWLGVPDLLRREPGESRFGEHHYVVGDIKSSWSSRSDQALQVAFYSRLLTRLQQRAPEYGYLVLRSGREERIDVRALDPVLDGVLAEIAEVVRGGATTRPHRSEKCHSCKWRSVCGLDGSVDWLPGLTRTTRALLRRAGFEAPESLLARGAESRAVTAGIARASFLRARHAAEAVASARALRTRAPRDPGPMGELHAVWFGRDGFDDRTLVVADRREGSAPEIAFAHGREEEVPLLEGLLERLSRGNASVVHGPEFSGVLADFAARQPDSLPRVQRIEQRAVPVLALVQGAHAFPAPTRDASEMVAWLHGNAPNEAAREQRSMLAMMLGREDHDGLRALADAELAALLELGAMLRESGAGA